MQNSIQTSRPDQEPQTPITGMLNSPPLEVRQVGLFQSERAWRRAVFTLLSTCADAVPTRRATNAASTKDLVILEERELS
jgi:hypothetical protein